MPQRSHKISPPPISEVMAAEPTVVGQWANREIVARKAKKILSRKGAKRTHRQVQRYLSGGSA